jgi:hypothetical protein
MNLTSNLTGYLYMNINCVHHILCIQSMLSSDFVYTSEETDSSISPNESQRQPEESISAVPSGRHKRSKSFQHGVKRSNNGVRKVATRSQSLSHDTYGRYHRSSGDYDHLKFLGYHAQA